MSVARGVGVGTATGCAAEKAVVRGAATTVAGEASGRDWPTRCGREALVWEQRRGGWHGPLLHTA